MNGNKYLLLPNTEETDMWNVVSGIRGIADALDNHHDYDDCPEGVLHLFRGLKTLSETLFQASNSAGLDEVRKVQAMLAEPDTRAEALSKKLRKLRLSLVEHVGIPGTYAVLDDDGSWQLSVVSIGEIEAWLDREQIGVKGGAS